jgi:hypothetical protein
MAHTTHHSSQSLFPQDVSEYLLEVPRRRLRFDWFLLAIAVGTLLALGVFTIANLVF